MPKNREANEIETFEDAERWRHVATLVREIDAQKRGVQASGLGDDEVLDTALRMIRGFQELVNTIRRHGWTGNPIEAINDAAKLITQRAQLLGVFEAVNAVAGPNVWLKQMREAIAQMDHNDGDSMLDLLSRAVDARGTVDDLNGVWDTTGPDESGEPGETGDCEG